MGKGTQHEGIGESDATYGHSKTVPSCPCKDNLPQELPQTTFTFSSPTFELRWFIYMMLYNIFDLQIFYSSYFLIIKWHLFKKWKQFYSWLWGVYESMVRKIAIHKEKNHLGKEQRLIYFQFLLTSNI